MTKGKKDIEIAKLKKKIARLEAEKQCTATEEELKRIYHNQWDLIENMMQPIADVVMKSRKDEWLWVNNWDCKYINLRIDMRSGHCVLLNNKGKRISAKQLAHQSNWKKINGEWVDVNRSQS